MKKHKKIGLDVGGSHVCAAIIDTWDPHKPVSNLVRKDINAFDSADNITRTIGSCIKELMHIDNTIDGVGLAFPGPFDYEKGVSAIGRVGGKFEKTFGLHVEQALKDITGQKNIPFRFSNDAHSFAKGAWYRHGLSSKKTVFLTLGTGFGSAFMDEGVLLSEHPSLPPGAVFFNLDFLHGKADDYFSTRWFLNEYQRRTGTTVSSVKDLVETQKNIARPIFEIFGFNLGAFLLPWLREFQCDELVIGGNITRASSLFKPALEAALVTLDKHVNIVFCPDTEDCILTGAALVSIQEDSKKEPGNHYEHLRKTTQAFLPLSPGKENKNSYNIFPSFHSKFPVQLGYHSLATWIGNEKTLVIDGYGGVLWEQFREQLHPLLSKKKKVCWYDINAALKPQEKINAMLDENLNGDDPVFGKKYNGALPDFFDSGLLAMIQPDPSADLCILYGTGAALANWKGPLIYVDLPKNEIQYRMRAGSITNLGSHNVLANSQTYKRFYFVDWPVLNKHKAQLLPAIDCVVDEQRIGNITWMQGDHFRQTLEEMLAQPFRARPWFEAGVWGGNWMKTHIKGLNKEEVNYAWSFELITPENGIVISGDNHLLEVSFDFLLYKDNIKLLGNAAQQFGYEFPIRFDFLDTYDGGNLSIQCHPRTSYIRKEFGENFTQDETYYILDCEPGAKVYLGFQDNIQPAEFKTALEEAQSNGNEMPAEKYVQELDAQKHDLFLIPNGTIHASGRNNLVLEISSTPYIYTFKMYDWQRLDLNGQPRPINIEHAFNNLYFDRKGDYVQQRLVSKPQVTAEWEGGRKLVLPTHEEHFYTIDRYEFEGSVQVETKGQCHICMVVEGEGVEVGVGGSKNNFRYAETFVIPASVMQYELNQLGGKKVFVVVAYVK